MVTNSTYIEQRGQGASKLRGAMRILSTVLVGLLVVLAVALVGVRLIGIHPYTVLSGSMEPTYATGSLIYVKDAAPEEIAVGDPITFVMNEDLVVATHRVIEVDAANQRFYTQGDANDAPDGAPVHFENLIGTPVLCVPYLGYALSYVQEPPGTYVAISACALALMLLFLPDLFARDSQEPPAKSRGAHARGASPQGRPARPSAARAQSRPRPTTNLGAPRATRRATHLQRPTAAVPSREGRRI